MFAFQARDAIRVKVKKCEGNLQPEYRKFSIDPQITSFEVLQSILARAFDIKSEFTISYLAKDDYGQDTYLPLLSDWDLEAACLSASDPCLRLKVDLKPFEEGTCLEDWDIITPVDVNRTNATGSSDRITLAGTILNQMEKTLNLVQRALNLTNESTNTYKPIKPPMNDIEFHTYLDASGQLVRAADMRLSIYQGGLEPSLRRVVWKHLLNVYPDGMTGRERMDYMKKKSQEYYRLRETWQAMISSGSVTDDMQVVTNMVRKDVLRTDRTHKFYAGADDNKNVVSLFNILTTYALNHPSVSYCQGMSDLASPLLVTLRDEAQAYVCFCGLMKRLKPNFMLDGCAMTLKFQHLSEGLQVYDPEFFEYLREHQADDLLFCYRWLLLELKREFAFDEALCMLEVLWSSLPPDPPKDDLTLYEVEFSTSSPHSPKLLTKENPYTKVRAMRRQSSTSSICGNRLAKTDSASTIVGSSVGMLQNGHADDDKIGENDASAAAKETLPRPLLRQESFAEGDSAGDDAQEYFPMTTSVTRELRMELENLNRRLPGSGRYLGRRLTIESEDLESPLSNDCSERSRLDSGPHSESVRVFSSESEDSDSVSLCSESDLSGGDQIKRIHEIHHSPCKSHKSAKVEKPSATRSSYGDSLKCTTPDEQRELEFSEYCEDESINCNGEILESEEVLGNSDHQPQLRNVVPIPIHLVRERSSDNTSQQQDSDSSDSTQDNGNHVESKAVYARQDSIQTPVTQKQEKLPENAKSAGLEAGVAENVMTNSCEEASESIGYASAKTRVQRLPPPQDFGGGNPFMIFLCLTLLLQHRDYILKNRMDYNELAMHFDKMVRKHDVTRVLYQARKLFAEYLQAGWHDNSNDSYQDLTV